MGSSSISGKVDLYEHFHAVDDGYRFRDIFDFDGRLRSDAVINLTFPRKRWYAYLYIFQTYLLYQCSRYSEAKSVCYPSRRCMSLLIWQFWGICATTQPTWVCSQSTAETGWRLFQQALFPRHPSVLVSDMKRFSLFFFLNIRYSDVVVCESV